MLANAVGSYLARRVPEVRNLHPVEPNGRRANVVGEVDHELQQQSGKARGLCQITTGGVIEREEGISRAN